MNRICEHPDFHLSYQLQPGDVQILSNYSQFHTRTAFTDPEPGEVSQGLGEGGRVWVGVGRCLRPQPETVCQLACNAKGRRLQGEEWKVDTHALNQ